MLCPLALAGCLFCMSNLKCTFSGVEEFELGPPPPPTPTPFSSSQSLGCDVARIRAPHAACVKLRGMDQIGFSAWRVSRDIGALCRQAG